MTEPRDDEILRVEAAAGFLGLAVSTLNKMRVRGDGPLFVKLTERAVGYRRRDLARFAEKRLRWSTSDEDLLLE